MKQQQQPFIITMPHTKNAAARPAAPLQAHSATRRSCDALGLCQHRQPACPGCSSHDTRRLPPGGFYFAPGVIDRGHPVRPMHRRSGLRAAMRWVGWVAMVVLATGAIASCSYALGNIYGLVQGGWL